MEIQHSAMHTFRILFSLVFMSSISGIVAAEQTVPSSDGGGNVIYLDRHVVDCGVNGIDSFRLTRPAETQIAYSYQCQWTGDSAGVIQSTLPNDNGGGNAIFLDRQNVDCGGKALQSFQLYNQAGNRMAYRYRCGEKPLFNIKDYYTPGDLDGGGNAIFLDRQNLSCPSGDVLTSFVLYRPTLSTIAYHFRCGETNPKQTKANSDGAGNMTLLSRHEINCKANGIGALRLFRPAMTQIAYSYQCQLDSVEDTAGKDQFTPANLDGGGNTLFLDRHTIDCGGKALQFLQLYQPGANQVAYRYRCGKQALVNVAEYSTPANDDGNGAVIFLDRHDVRCPADSSLTYLRLYRPTLSKIAYQYKCGKYQTGKDLANALVQSAYDRSASTLYGNDRQEMDALKARLNSQINSASGLSLEEYKRLGKQLSDQIEQLYVTLLTPGPRLLCPAGGTWALTGN